MANDQDQDERGRHTAYPAVPCGSVAPVNVACISGTRLTFWDSDVDNVSGMLRQGCVTVRSLATKLYPAGRLLQPKRWVQFYGASFGNEAAVRSMWITGTARQMRVLLCMSVHRAGRSRRAWCAAACGVRFWQVHGRPAMPPYCRHALPGLTPRASGFPESVRFAAREFPHPWGPW